VAWGRLLRLAAQVQARTQQLATAKGQGEQLLNRTHGPNLAAGAWRMQQRVSNFFGRCRLSKRRKALLDKRAFSC
jgi:hypothetical protein